MIDNADLRNADLSYADLCNADLSFNCFFGGSYGAPVYQACRGFGSRNATLTLLALGEPEEWRFFTGCFRGTRAELEAAVAEKHGETKEQANYLRAIEYLSAAYTRPHEPAGKYLHTFLAEHCPCLTTEPLPAHGALTPHTITPQQARQPLQVVSPAAAGYTAADLAEIYPSH